MKKGYFITFEGPEGSGKSTHSKLLVKFLRSKNFDTIYTREPGGTFIGKKIRKIILEPSYKSMSDRCELFLYLADRAQHAFEKIKPVLDAGKIVVSDRYSDATIAYQGFGRVLDLETIKLLNKIATDNIIPDLTILLDIDVKEGLLRAISQNKSGGDRLELETIKFHKTVQAGYKKILKSEPKRVYYIKVDSDIHQIQNKIRKVVLERLNRCLK